MFTLIQNYRTLFMMCVTKSFEGNAAQIDRNNSNGLDLGDLTGLSDAQREAVIRLFQTIGVDMNRLSSRTHFTAESIQDRITDSFLAEYNRILSETGDAQREHRSNVIAENNILSHERLASAVSFINRMAADQRNALAGVLPGRQGNSTDLAQAVARFQAENGLTVDGKPGRATIAAVNAQTTARTPERAQTRTEAAAETTAARIIYPPQGRDQIIALQTLIGTNPDGAFGPASRRKLQEFLRDRGFYTGAIDGDIGRGSRAAIEAYNNGTRTVERTTPDASVNAPDRNALERFFGIGDREAMRARLDQFIGASDRDLISLGQEAGAAKISGDTAEINRVYGRIMTELQSRNLPQEIYNAFNVRSQRDKMIVLDYFENALMGSEVSQRVARGETGAEEYLANSDRVLAEAARVLNRYSFKDQSLATVRSLRSHMRGHLESTALGEGVYFVVRTQGDTERLSPFTHGQEALTINGANMWEVQENQADILRLITQMSANQLSYIARTISYSGTLTKDRLTSLVQAGTVSFNVQMYLAENCSNISYRLIPSGRIPSHFSESHDRGEDDVGTDPGVGDPNGNDGHGTTL